MQKEPTPGPPESGLSTEDLAEPRGPDTDTEPESRPEASTYPGEATASEPAASPAQTETETTAAADDQPQLLTAEDEEGFRSRWQEIQSQFVDDPREAVQGADALIADVMQTLAATFAEHKQDLEKQWNRGEEANTEDLRTALHKYRSFFRRLLST
jgi:hypothetical protein